VATQRKAYILTVCTANVCRSPLAEFVLRESLGDLPGFESVVVESAGAGSARADAVCTRVAGRRDTEQWRDLAAAHRPRTLAKTLVTRSQLILTASRSARAAVARIAPDARSRTFTMREALWLAEDYRPDASLVGRDAVLALAAYLDRQRGLRPLPAVRPKRLWGPTPADPFDIRDGHNVDERAHGTTLDDVEHDARRLAALLSSAAEQAKPGLLRTTLRR
jgi:protein-tyrosine phosphatase